MDEKQEVKGKRIKLKKYHILIFILFLFLLGGIIVHFRSSTKSKLRLKIDALRAKGYTVLLEELNQSYSIPDNVENAADFILDAVSYYVEPNNSNVQDITGWVKQNKMSDETMKHAAEYLYYNQKSLELLHKAALLEYCRYPINLNIGQQPKLIDIQKMVRLLCVEAVVHAENGNSAASAKSLIHSINIADSLSNVPINICQLGRIVYQKNNISTLQSIINIIDFTDEQLAQLSKAISDKQRLSGVSYGLAGQLCDSISIFEDITVSNDLLGANASFAQRLFYSVYRSFGLIESDGVIYLDIIDKFIEAGKLPLDERLEAAKGIQTEIDNISSIHIQLKGTVPNYTQFLSRELTNISKFRVAQTALAVQRYRLKNGQLPNLLSSLVPEFLESIPSDPFDGNQLRYKKLDSGFVVYSVDEDMIDDGGQEEPKDRNQKVTHWDITFILDK
ncbi:MAG: hypothetical protein JXA96_00935 [Sedimentisphaerales bacterium]|nr:hypothetical protein [Sedimentisphaerales bacterium]